MRSISCSHKPKQVTFQRFLFAKDAKNCMCTNTPAPTPAVGAGGVGAYNDEVLDEVLDEGHPTGP